MPVPSRGLQDSLPDPWVAASSAVSRDEAFQDGVRTFPWFQKNAQSAGSPSARVHGHSSSWTPAAYEEPTPALEGFFVDDASGVWVHMDIGIW